MGHMIDFRQIEGMILVSKISLYSLMLYSLIELYCLINNNYSKQKSTDNIYIHNSSIVCIICMSKFILFRIKLIHR